MIHVDNPDPPEAAGPPVVEEWQPIHEGLIGEALREVDPHPMAAIHAMKHHIVAAQRELEKPSLGQDEVDEIRKHLDAAMAKGDPLKWHKPESTVDVNRSLVEAVVEWYAEADLFCDHAVGICACGSLGINEELKLWLEGNATCRKCGRDGYVWDEAVYLEKTAEIARQDKVSVEEVRSWGDDYGNVMCPECGGAGIVRVTK